MSHSLLFCVVFALLLIGTVSSVQVGTADDLINIFEAASGTTLKEDIDLLADLDFSGKDLTLPFGATSSGRCVAYSGVFHGNGHSIKGLQMNATNNTKYHHAGLFCGLKDATVENLVIDSSCSFIGRYVGALGVSITGSLAVKNVTNKAFVNGTTEIGGFIGGIEEVKQETVVSFENCTNDGGIVASSKYLGGFVGFIGQCTSITMAFSDCVNNGVITGSIAGGFVGRIESNTNIIIAFSNCTNNNFVSGDKSGAGGFLGSVWGNKNMTMTLSHCTNNGNTTVNEGVVAGFVSSIYSNENINVVFSDCINNGNVMSDHSYQGGFVGSVSSNTNMTMMISRCVNNGNITGGEFFSGGFVVSISYSKNTTVTISNSINNGNVTGRSFVGGLVGQVDSSSTSDSILFTVINSANKGTVSAKSIFGCGLFCVSPENYNMNTTVLNSINKGGVVAREKPCGITNNITMARNVVSMGKVIGLYSYTFWEGFMDVKSFFGLSDCVNCTSDATLFDFNTNTGFFEVVESGEHVDDLLNDGAVNQHFGMLWTNELEFVDKLMFEVSVRGLLSGSFLVESGTPLGGIGDLQQYFNDEEHGVVSEKSQTRVVCNERYLVSRNMSFIVGKWVGVSVGLPFSRQEKMVIGETLDQVSQLFGFSLDGFIVVDNDTNKTLNESWVLETSVSLRLCHSLTVSGIDPFSDLIDHGTALGQIEQLSRFFNESFIVFDASDPDSVFAGNTPVERNMDVTVSEVSRQEIIVVIDGITNVSVDDIKDAITDVIVVPDGEHVWVDVVSEGDGSYHISVIKTDGVTDSVSDLLKECLKHKS